MRTAFNQRTEYLAAFVIYFTIVIVVVDRGLFGAVPRYIGQGTDPSLFMWFLRWWPWAILHFSNPFWSHAVWAPVGFNLAWTTCVPLPALISSPIEAAFGVAAAYNALITIAMPLAAVCAFALCRWITGHFGASLIGGYLFGFSSYILNQSLGHLHLVAIFPTPLIALAALKWIAREISTRRYVAALTALLVIQFLCSIELFATVTFVAGIAILAALWLFKQETRRTIAALIVPTAAAYAISALLLSPYLYFVLMQGFPDLPLWDPGRYSADLINLIVPSSTIWIGAWPAMAALAATFGTYIQDSGAYLGLPLLLLAEDFRRRNRQTERGKFLALMLVIAIVMSLGPNLRFLGRPTFIMPWALMTRLPQISSAMPVRFVMFATLILAVMAALWFAGERSATVKTIAALAIGISIFPNPQASYWTSPIDLPRFFADGAYRSEIRPDESLLVLPYGQRGFSMYWQAWTTMYFRMASGYTGPWPFEFERMPAAPFLFGAIDLPEPVDQLKAYLARFGVEAIVADEREPLFAIQRPVLGGIGIEPIERDGFRIYNVPNGALNAYAKLSPTYLETRAVALRFDTILTATAKYMSAGNDLARLSPLILKRDGLLPADWIIDPAEIAFRDWNVGGLHGGRIGIVVAASYPVARLLWNRYQADAIEINYPGSHRWTSGAEPSRQATILPMALIFDRAHLRAAAERLRSSPPPEMTTSFLAGASALLR